MYKFVKLRYPNIKSIDFPLAFVSKEEKHRYKKTVQEDRQWIMDKYDLPADVKIVSSYGFISKYKGFDTAIKAIYECPDNYRLIIFGSVHPNGIEKFTEKDKYLGDLIGITERRNKGIPDLLQELLDDDKKIAIDISNISSMLNETKKKENKVIFAGSLNDNDFERAMNGSDLNVLSYLEVGQTSSGPIAISLDLGKTTISTYNKCFNQLCRYSEDSFYQFDIGNNLQLKGLIEYCLKLNQTPSGISNYIENYNVENRASLIYDKYTEIKGGKVAKRETKEEVKEEVREYQVEEKVHS